MMIPATSKFSAGLLLAGILLSNVGLAGGDETFACEATARQEKFVATGVEMGLSRDDALVLYGLSGGASIYWGTGCAPAKDRRPTVTRAIDVVATNQFESAYYVEVDIQNLGGLNAELGHTGADNVYSKIARITEQHVENLRADVVGSGNTQAQVEAALAAADREIRQYIADKGLADIEHPKHRGNKAKSGAGIIFGVSRIRGQAQLADVFSAADRVVEQKKL